MPTARLRKTRRHSVGSLPSNCVPVSVGTFEKEYPKRLHALKIINAENITHSCTAVLRELGARAHLEERKQVEREKHLWHVLMLLDHAPLPPTPPLVGLVYPEMKRISGLYPASSWWLVAGLVMYVQPPFCPFLAKSFRVIGCPFHPEGGAGSTGLCCRRRLRLSLTRRADFVFFVSRTGSMQYRLSTYHPSDVFAFCEFAFAARLFAQPQLPIHARYLNFFFFFPFVSFMFGRDDSN